MDEERPLRPLWRVGSYTKHAALYHMHGADNGECPRGEGGERKEERKGSRRSREEQPLLTLRKRDESFPEAVRGDVLSQ